jgi:hypothetical protein
VAKTREIRTDGLFASAEVDELIATLLRVRATAIAA